MTKDFGVKIPTIGDYVTKIGENSLDFHAEGSTWPEIKLVAKEYSFFHWDLEFPDIFYDIDGRRKKNPGFDAVVGNPPYGRYNMFDEKQKNFLKDKKLLGKTGDISESFIRLILQKLIKQDSYFGFIIPKGLSYVKSWTDCRKLLLRQRLIKLVDVSQAFEHVHYEQMVFVLTNHNCNDKAIEIGSIKTDHVEFSKLNRQYFNERIFPIGIDDKKIKIYEKITNNSQPIRNFVDYWYGKGGMTPKINFKKKGIKLLTGKEIIRYGFTKKIQPWFLESKHLKSDDIKKMTLEKVVVQDIIAHITKPIPHIKITAAIDYEKKFCLNTVMCFSQNGRSNIQNEFLVGLINSKLISFYFYYFIFNQSIRTMHFMPGYANYMPIPNNIQKFQDQITNHSKKMIEFVKQPVDDSILKQMKEISCKIDQMVYKIYDLNNNEIKLIEKLTPE